MGPFLPTQTSCFPASLPHLLLMYEEEVDRLLDTTRCAQDVNCTMSITYRTNCLVPCCECCRSRLPFGIVHRGTRS